MIDRGGRMSHAFRSARHMFGRTPRLQQHTAQLHSHAYYCLLDVGTIECVVNGIVPQFEGISSTPDYTSWLQTVTVL